MSKITLPSIASGYASTTQLNNAFDAIETEFQDKVLYRDNPSGEPNQMEQDLDMNSNAIDNVSSITTDEINVGGVNLTAQVAAAANSASAAANSATAASTSASASASSASASASSAASAASSYDNFDDRYLGEKSTAPSLDNDGNTILVGALYFNTTDSNMYVRTASNTWATVNNLTASTNAANSASAALVSENNAAASESAAASSESAAATSETNSANSASASASSASAAATSATNADSAKTTAITKANEASTSASNAASSASSASTSASTATTKASEASTSASNAATSASNAASSASAASSSASAASTSQSNAASSASAASTSASNASSSAAAAAASYDSFDDRYLGPKSSIPSVDNDGNALLEGALYWNTSVKKMYIWDGSTWNQAAFDTTGAVLSFNTRTGAVTLSSADVTNALGYTPTNYADASPHFSGNMTIDGDLTVLGTTVTINTSNLTVEDNMIYLNNGSTVTNPDLGFAGNYNDGTYRHAGMFRDATDGRWKFYHQYTLEPDASPFIDTSHASFTLADIQANRIYSALTGNVTGNADTVTNGLYTTDLGVTVQAYDADIPTVSASQVEMETGSETANRSMSPLRVKQAIVANAPVAFPSGTKLIFAQTAAPTGWTKDVTHNDKALRVVSGAASSGGSVDFSVALASKTPSGSVSVSGSVGSTTATGSVGATTLSTAQIPSHTHSSIPQTASGGGAFYATNSYQNVNTNGNTGSTGGGGSHDHSLTINSHSHTFSGSGTLTGDAINLAVKYVDVIIATKD